MGFEIEVNAGSSEGFSFVVWYDILKEKGVFAFLFSLVIWNGEKSCLTFSNPDGEAFTVYAVHHENAKFTDSTPDGVRALRALARAVGIEGATTAEAVVEAVNSQEFEATIKVEATEKGRLWTVLTEAEA